MTGLASRNGGGLVLIGYRGTGKSTVGRLLARRLGWEFADADHVLEAKAGQPIKAIFAESGEPAFRDLEQQVLAELTAPPRPLVLATGGGAILRAPNRDALRRFGWIAWLKADPNVLAARIDRDGNRPGLTSAGAVAEIPKVLAARMPLYKMTCHAEIETDGLSQERVADLVLAAWQKATADVGEGGRS